MFVACFMKTSFASAEEHKSKNFPSCTCVEAAGAFWTNYNLQMAGLLHCVVNFKYLKSCDNNAHMPWLVHVGEVNSRTKKLIGNQWRVESTTLQLYASVHKTRLPI